MRIGTSLLAMSALAIAAPAMATTTIDQSNTSGTTMNGLTFSGAGQSFTPTLKSINFASFTFAAVDSTLQATLYSGSGITGTNLAVSNIVALSGSSFQNVDFTFGDTMLTAGNTYTLFVRALSGRFGQTFSASNPYAGGNAFGQNGLEFSGVDLRFAEGGTAAVPEPASWMMMIFGMGAVGFAMRRWKVATRISYAF